MILTFTLFHLSPFIFSFPFSVFSSWPADNWRAIHHVNWIGIDGLFETHLSQIDFMGTNSYNVHVCVYISKQTRALKNTPRQSEKPIKEISF